MAFYAYPRLPLKIPIWLNFFGKQTIMIEKSPLFFIYILAQALFFMFFLVMTRIISSRKMVPWKAPIFKECAYLILIFFNLIFIHIQKVLFLYLIRWRKESTNTIFIYCLALSWFLFPTIASGLDYLLKSPKKQNKPQVCGPNLSPATFLLTNISYLCL